MPELDLDTVKQDLIGIAEKALSGFIEVIKQDGAEAAAKGKEFAAIAQALTKDLVDQKITQQQFRDGLANIELALESYLLAEGLKQSRKQLGVAVSILKKVAKIAISVVVSLL